VSSCCHGRLGASKASQSVTKNRECEAEMIAVAHRFRPTRGFQRRGTRVRQRGRLEATNRVSERDIEDKLQAWTHLEHQHQFAEHSYPFGAFCEYDRQGTEDLPLKTWIAEP